MSALELARAQFAFTISFHIIFPALSIGLASYLAVLEGLWLTTGRKAYLLVFNFWLKIFAICFGMGVVSGVVMSYEFGTNWSVFSDRTGPVLGPQGEVRQATSEAMQAIFGGADVKTSLDTAAQKADAQIADYAKRTGTS